MNWLVPFMSMYLAVVSPGGYINYSEPVIETNITTGFEMFDMVTIDNDINVFSAFPTGGYFSPYQIDFKIRAFVEFDNVRFGYYHECFHPTNMRNMMSYTGANDVVFIQYDTRLTNGNK